MFLRGADLRFSSFGLVDLVAESQMSRMRAAVPAQVLARDAHTHVFAIEGVQGFKVSEQVIAHLDE